MPNRRRNRKNLPQSAKGGGLNFGSGSNYRPTLPRGPSAARTMMTCMPLERTPHFQTGMGYYENGLTLTGGGAGTIGNYFFRANDVFDPNATGVGHQPMGFDQMMLLFEQFYVLRAHIRVRLYNTSGAGFFPVVGIAVTPDQTSIVSESCMEQGLLVSRELAAKGTTGDHCTLVLTCDNPRYFGVKRQPYIASSLFQGTSGNSPTEMSYFKLFIFDLAAANAVTANFEVSITYDVYFDEPRQLGESLVERAAELTALNEQRAQRKLQRIRDEESFVRLSSPGSTEEKKK